MTADLNFIPQDNIDFGAIMEAVNKCIPNNKLSSYITRTYYWGEGGCNFYRLYNDGYCIQRYRLSPVGTDGSRLLQLIIPFRDTFYFTIVTPNGLTKATGNTGASMSTDNTTNSTCTIVNDGYGNYTYTDFMAMGYTDYGYV